MTDDIMEIVQAYPQAAGRQDFAAMQGCFGAMMELDKFPGG